MAGKNNNGNDNNSKRKIMLVDDDKDFLEEMREMLDFYGYEPVLFDDPVAALKSVSAIKPDVLLLDLKMDKMNGFQLAKELGQLEETERIPVIAVTAYYTKEEYANVMHVLGIKKCITKPFKPLDVIQEIEKAISEKES